MRVLFLVDDLDGTSLSEPALWLGDVMERWVSRGHRVDVLCRRPLEANEDPDDPQGMRVLRPSVRDFEVTLGEMLETPPDVVHVASKGPFGPRVVETMDELPVLLDVHDYWPICPNDDLLRRPHMKACAEHFPFAGCGPCAGLTRLRAMEERSELARRARAVMAHSGISRVRLQTGLQRPVDLVDYGVDAQRFCLEPEPPLSPAVAELLSRRDRPRVLFLGPPSVRRGAALLVDLLVALRSRVPGVELVIAGRDPAHPDADQVLWAEARELGLADSLRILPRVPPHDLPALNAACDVGIALSIGEEPAALFVEQAMASGLPVIASPLGAHEDLIRHGEEGLLLSPHDLGAFTAGICSILLDPLARPRFQDAARLRVLERHDRERAMVALEEIYERLSRGVQFRSVA